MTKENQRNVASSELGEISFKSVARLETLGFFAGATLFLGLGVNEAIDGSDAEKYFIASTVFFSFGLISLPHSFKKSDN